MAVDKRVVLAIVGDSATENQQKLLALKAIGRVEKERRVQQVAEMIVNLPEETAEKIMSGIFSYTLSDHAAAPQRSSEVLRMDFTGQVSAIRSALMQLPLAAVSNLAKEIGTVREAVLKLVEAAEAECGVESTADASLRSRLKRVKLLLSTIRDDEQQYKADEDIISGRKSLPGYG